MKKIPLDAVWPEPLLRHQEYTIPLCDIVGINFELFQEKVRRRIDGRMTVVRKSRFAGRFWCKWFLLWFLCLLFLAGMTAVSGPISALIGMFLTIFGVVKHKKVPAWLIRTIVFSCVPLLLLRALWAVLLLQVASPEGLAIIAEARYWLNAFGGLTTITALGVASYFLFQNREIANAYLMTPLRQSSLFLPTEYSPIPMDQLEGYEIPPELVLPSSVASSSSSSSPSSPSPSCSSGSSIPSVPPFLSVALVALCSGFRAISSYFHDLPFPPPIDGGGENVYRAWPLGLSFREKYIVEVLAIRTKLLTETDGHKITQVWVGSMYFEAVLLHVLPSCLYNSSAMRIGMNFTLDLLVPVFLLLQGIFHVIPWLRSNMAWMSVMIQTDVGLRLVRLIAAWVAWVLLCLMNFFSIGIFEAILQVFAPVLQFGNNVQNLLHASLDVAGDYVFQLTSFVNYAQTNLWSHFKIFIISPLKMIASLMKSVASPFSAMARPFFRWWSTIHIPKPPSLVSTFHHIWDRFISLYNKTVLFFVNSWLPHKLATIWTRISRKTESMSPAPSAFLYLSLESPVARTNSSIHSPLPSAKSPFSRSTSCSGTPSRASRRCSAFEISSLSSKILDNGVSPLLSESLSESRPVSSTQQRRRHIRRTRSAGHVDLEHSLR